MHRRVALAILRVYACFVVQKKFAYEFISYDADEVQWSSEAFAAHIRVCLVLEQQPHSLASPSKNCVVQCRVAVGVFVVDAYFGSSFL